VPDPPSIPILPLFVASAFKVKLPPVLSVPTVGVIEPQASMAFPKVKLAAFLLSVMSLIDVLQLKID
jgi:hypothetical protein